MGALQIGFSGVVRHLLGRGYQHLAVALFALFPFFQRGIALVVTGDAHARVLAGCRPYLGAGQAISLVAIH